MKKPFIDDRAFIAPDAAIYGDVTIESGCSIWFHTTMRAEDAKIFIGKNSNVQDNTVVHVDEGSDAIIGEGVTIGHSAIIHGCRIDDNTLVGMGAIIMNDAHIGKNCVIGAGALVTQGTVIPDNSMVLGMPGRVIRQLTPEEIESNRENALIYIKEGEDYTEYFEKE